MGYASVRDLSRRFNLSEVSVRRDLKSLEELGLLRRTHGGAQIIDPPRRVPVFDTRLHQRVDAKRAIGKAAAAMICPGDTILLDAGTTVLEVARNLPASLLFAGGLTVVTRSLVIASEVRLQRATRLVVLGGLYNHDFDVFVGPSVLSALTALHVDILFLGADSLTIERGLTTDYIEEANLYPLMARCAERVVVVTDSTKLGVNGLQAILPLDQIDVLVTDVEAPSYFVDALRARGIDVRLVELGQREEVMPSESSGLAS